VNVGTLSGRSGEVVEMVRYRRLDLYCIGVLVHQKWIKGVTEVKRVNKRILVLRVVVWKHVLSTVSLNTRTGGQTNVGKDRVLH